MKKEKKYREPILKRYEVSVVEEVPYIVRVSATSVADARKRAEDAFYDLRLLVPVDPEYPNLKENSITNEDMEQWGDVRVKVGGAGKG